MIKFFIGLVLGSAVGFFTAALMQTAKEEKKEKPKYCIDDSITFSTYGGILAKGKIVAIKGIVFKKYRVSYQFGLFNTRCDWVRAKNIVKLAKEGQA